MLTNQWTKKRWLKYIPFDRSSHYKNDNEDGDDDTEDNNDDDDDGKKANDDNKNNDSDDDNDNNDDVKINDTYIITMQIMLNAMMIWK